MRKNPSNFFFCHCKLFEQSNGMSVYFPLSLKLLSVKILSIHFQVSGITLFFRLSNVSHGNT